MKILSNQSFWDKLLNFGMLLLIIKLISILLSFFYLPAGEVFISLLLFLLVAFVILMAISFMKDSKFSPNSGGRSSGSGGLGSGGSAFVGIELFNKIYRKYEEAAEKYIEQKEYKKAANIYLRLLQNPHQAAETLEDGKLYSEAAIIYLKKLNDKNSAAKCYEKALEYNKAIKLYTELEQFEKVGDLYKLQNNLEKANHFYNIVIENYLKKNQYVKASLVYRYKMETPQAAQNILKTGWEKNQDSYNCLNNYFQNISDLKILEREIDGIYGSTNYQKKETLLKVIKKEYEKHEKLRSRIKEIGYEIISERAEKIPAFTSELKFFNEGDLVISKDIALFRSSKSNIIR